ncbi:hypothetical protein ACOMHN_006401 [Nucella lapillus]
METIHDISTKENADPTGITTLNASPGADSVVLDYTSVEPYHSTMTLLKVCSPLIVALGTFGNVMTLLILRTMPLGAANSVSVFFAALAVSDLVLLYTGLLRRWLFSMGMGDVRNLHDAVCKLHLFLVYLSGMTSAWFLVAMTLQRVTSVLWPHRVALMCTRRKSQVTVGLLVLLLAALNSPLMVIYTLRTPTTTSTAAPTCSPVDDANLQFFDSIVQPWIDLVVSSFLPSLLLLLGNSALTLTLYGSMRQARQMTSQGDTTTTTRKKATSSLTVTLISVSVTYLCLTLPVCVFSIVYEYLDDSDIYFVAWMELVWMVCNLLWYCNSAINFYLYCLTGSKFRAQSKRLLCLAASPRDARAFSTSGILVTTKTSHDHQPRSVLRPTTGENQQDSEDF